MGAVVRPTNLQAETLAFEIEPFPGDAQRSRGRIHFAVMGSQRDADHFAFDARKRGEELVGQGNGDFQAVGGPRGLGRGAQDRSGEGGRHQDRVGVCERDHAAQLVLELADVAGPRVQQHVLHRLLGDANSSFRELGCGACDEVVDEHGDFVAALAQGRNRETDDVEPIVQVFAESAVLHELLEVGVGGRDDAHVDGHRCGLAERVDFARFEETEQLGLEVEAKLADLVEEQGAVLSGPDEPQAVIGPGEGSAAMTEELALEQLVLDGRFREDLYYRLNVIRLTIPPLRERRDEIPILIHHFVARAASEFSKGQVRIAEETMEHLLLYPWPGNIRQLQNELRRMVALADADSVLMPAALSEPIQQATPRALRPINGLELAVPLTDKLIPTLSRIEGEMIRVALRAHHGKVEAAARALGISRKGLYLKRQRLGL